MADASVQWLDANTAQVIVCSLASRASGDMIPAGVIGD